MLSRCPTDTQIKKQIITQLFHAACNQQALPGVWLLEAVLWKQLGYRGCRVTIQNIPQSILGNVTEHLNKLGAYHTKKGKRATLTRDEYLARLHGFLAYAGLRTNYTPCDALCRHSYHRDVEQLVARYVNAREQETSKAHYIPKSATQCPVSGCFATGKPSQRLSFVYARFAWSEKVKASPTVVPPICQGPIPQGISDEDRQIVRDTMGFFQGLAPEVVAWAAPIANFLIEKPLQVDPQTWSPDDCKSLLTKLKEEYVPLLLNDNTTPDSQAFAALRAKAVSLLEQLDTQHVAYPPEQARNFDDFTWNVDDFVKEYYQAVFGN